MRNGPQVLKRLSRAEKRWRLIAAVGGVALGAAATWLFPTSDWGWVTRNAGGGALLGSGLALFLWMAVVYRDYAFAD